MPTRIERAKGAPVASIPDDEPLPTDVYHVLLKQLGFRTQTDAAKALGLSQGYLSELNTGKKQVLPNTPTHKLLQALLREQALLRRLERLERQSEGPVTTE